MKNKRGLLGLLALIVVLIALSGWWFFSHYDWETGEAFSENNLTACTEEAKVCDDGGVVVRNSSKDCEFDACYVNNLTEPEIVEIVD